MGVFDMHKMIFLIIAVYSSIGVGCSSGPPAGTKIPYPFCKVSVPVEQLSAMFHAAYETGQRGGDFCFVTSSGTKVPINIWNKPRTVLGPAHDLLRLDAEEKRYLVDGIAVVFSEYGPKEEIYGDECTVYPNGFKSTIYGRELVARWRPDSGRRL